jgi:hypothetical protein
MANDEAQRAMRARKAVGAALAAGTLLMAGPAGIAFADTPSGEGGGPVVGDDNTNGLPTNGGPNDDGTGPPGGGTGNPGDGTGPVGGGANDPGLGGPRNTGGGARTPTPTHHKHSDASKTDKTTRQTAVITAVGQIRTSLRADDWTHVFHADLSQLRTADQPFRSSGEGTLRPTTMVCASSASVIAECSG